MLVFRVHPIDPKFPDRTNEVKDYPCEHWEISTALFSNISKLGAARGIVEFVKYTGDGQKIVERVWTSTLMVTEI